MNLPTPNEYAKKHAHNPFPPRWEKWLSAVRQSILSAQPRAGRYVSIDEHPGKGTVINVERRPGAEGGGAVGGACCIDGGCSSIYPDATSCEEAGGTWGGDGTVCTCEDETWDCPDECSPPEGDCVHYVSFQLKLTQCDISNEFSNLFDIGNASPSGGVNLFVDNFVWHFSAGFAGDHAEVEISTDDVPLVACQCYNIVAGFSDPGGDGDITMSLCINGFSSSVSVSRGAPFLCASLSPLDIGALFGGDAMVGRKYRRFIASPGFDMSTNPFDTLVNASVITESGENVLLIDDASDPAYAEVNLSWTINCSGC